MLEVADLGLCQLGSAAKANAACASDAIIRERKYAPKVYHIIYDSKGIICIIQARKPQIVGFC